MDNNDWVDVRDNDWVDVSDGFVDVTETKPKRTLLQTATTPISKLITGKSIGERTNFLEKQQDVLSKQATTKAIETGKPTSTAEFFVKGLPAATAQALVNFFDLSPLDVGIAAATAGTVKIPVQGTTVGQVAKTIPIGKGFMKNVSELGRYEQTLKTITPFSSRGVTQPIESISTAGITPTITKPSIGQLTSTVNLSKYKPEIQSGITKIINSNPDLLARKSISHNELDLMAQKLESTPIVKKILAKPEGEMAAEILKLRKGEDAIIRSALKDDVDKLVVNMKNVLQVRQTQAVGRVATETGRALEQFKIPIETQQEWSNLINQKILQVRSDRTIATDEAKNLISALIDFRKTVLSKEFNPTWFDKGYEFWLNNILSGPWTHTVNITSNTLFGGIAKPIEKATYAFFDSLISMGTGKRTHYYSEIPAQIQGFGKFIKGKQIPTGIAAGSKLESNVGLIKGIKGEIIRLPTKGLVVEDNFAKRLTGWMDLVGRAETIAKQEGLKGSALIARKNQLLSNPTGKLVEEVNKEQLIRTFQDSTGLGEFLKLIPTKGLRWVLPFRQVLASILTKAVERTPAGLVKVAIKGGKAIKGVPYTQSEIAVDLGNASIGTSILAGTMYGLYKGNVIGAAPKDKAARDLFYAQGKQPYSMLIGDKYVPFSRLEPYGTAMMYMTDFLQGYAESDKDVPISKLTDAVGRISYSLANKTFLTGMTYLVQSLADPQRYSEDMITRTLSGFVPFAGALRNIRQIKDLTVREPEGIAQGIGSQIPIVSETLPPRVSSLGNIVQRKPIGLTKFIPFPITNKETNQVADELVRLNINIGYPNKKITDIYGKNEKKLSVSEYNQYLMRKGGVTVNTLNKLISSNYYQKLPDDYKTKLIDGIVTKIGSVVKTEFKLNKFQNTNTEEWEDVK